MVLNCPVTMLNIAAFTLRSTSAVEDMDHTAKRSSPIAGQVAPAVDLCRGHSRGHQ